MKFTLRQDLVALGDDFTIKDEAGRVVYEIDGKLIGIGDTLLVKDPDGQEVARIEQKLLRLTPTYEIRRGRETLAVVKKKLIKVLRDRFVIDVPGPDDLEAVGSFLDHDYRLKRGGRTVATVSKAWVSLTDRYGVEVEEGEDPLLPLLTVVVIDLVCHAEEDEEADA